MIPAASYSQGESRELSRGSGRTRWVYVSLPYATFAVAARDGYVVEAAPVARWAVRRPEWEVAAYWRRKGAFFCDLPGK